MEERFQRFDLTGAYAAAVVLALLALATLLAMNLIKPKEASAVSIVVESVSKRFGDFAALDDVSIEVADGSLTALLGPSGGGKSTLLRVIAGLEQPDEGRVLISGEEATHTPPQRRNVGFVFQHYAAFKHMTVAKNVAFAMTIRKRPKEEIDARVDELLKLVHLDGFAHRYPSQLSGGQRQRMALARALAVEPRVLLLDEPFGALDATVRKELRAWLRRLHDEVHVTTLFVTHDRDEAMELANHVVVLADGKVEQAGSPDDLYDRPANEFVMKFIGEVTQLGDRLVRPHDLQILREPGDGTTEALVERVLRLGFEVRVELVPADSEHGVRPAVRRGGGAARARAGPDRVRAPRHRRARRRASGLAATMRGCESPRKPTTPCAPPSSSRPTRARRPLKGELIAQAQGIPLRFLENILGELRTAGVLDSRRGAEGGYLLARPAAEISLGDVIRAVDGPLANVTGARPEALEYSGASAPLREVWVAVRSSLREVLDEVTLADVAGGSLPQKVVRMTEAPDAWQPR